MKRLPEYLKRGIVNTETTKRIRKILHSKCLSTVCESARCPNKNECYSKNTATFLILGTKCTRNCGFCNIEPGIPDSVDFNEPERIAEAVKDLGLEYVVITSVTRDDLEDQGASQFANVIKEINKISQTIKVEVLTPDFQGDKTSINIVLEAMPDVFNHNIETVPELYKTVRPQAVYQRSIDFLNYIKQEKAGILTKTGLMLGLGETKDQLVNVFKDLVCIKCDILTIGQYIQPSKNHLEVVKFYEQGEYLELETIAQEIGIKHTFFSPLTRSSYKAMEVFCQ